MIVTHTRNAEGRCRVYLGGKGSLECWIEPKADGRGWSFHINQAVTGNALTPEDERAWAVHMLFALARLLNTPPGELADVPFECIAALHSEDPYANRRVAAPRRRAIDNGFMGTVPGITRPQGDYIQRDGASHRRDD